MKNVIAIAIGILDGLPLGANARATLMTQGLSEMHRLRIKMGAQNSHLLGACRAWRFNINRLGSDLSRNRQLGLKIGQGYTVAEAQNSLGACSEGFLIQTPLCRWHSTIIHLVPDL